MSLSDIRREYLGEPLDEAHSDTDPFAQFSAWFEQVRTVEADPTAMALATSTRDGRPSVRTVLLKGVREEDRPLLETFGVLAALRHEAHLFTSLDDAIAHARSHVGQSA